MGVVTGLDAIRSTVEKSNSSKEDLPPVKWVKIKDGESVRVDFLQELDENSKGFSPKNGSIIIAVEHVNPKDFKNKALCTADEGACLGCELNKQYPDSTWYQKKRLYANVLVQRGEQEPEVQVLSQGLGGRSITPTLLETNDIYGSITANSFRLRRSGSDMSSTSYTLLPLPGESDVDAESYELFDLSKVAVRDVPYEDQAKFFGLEEAESDTADAGTDTDW